MFVSLLLISTIHPGPIQEPDGADSGLPHPVYPVHGLEGHASNFTDQPQWVSLRPTWADREPLLHGDTRRALLERGVGSLGLAESTVEAWYAATRPAGLAVNYRILVDGYEALVGREVLPMGKAVSFGDLSRKHSVLDFDVEIASGAGIFDPVMGTQVSGASLALQALPVPGRGWALEAAMAYTKRLPGTPIALDYVQVEGKDRLITRLAECGSHALILPGGTLRYELPALGPGRVTLEIVADREVPRGPIVLSEQAIFLSVPTLAYGPHWDRVLREIEQQHELWTNSQGDLLFTGPEAEAGALAVMGLVDAMNRPIRLELEVEQVVGGVEGESSKLSASVFEERRFAFAQGTLRDALVDWDVEVAQIARIGDPYFHHYFSGWDGEILARRLGQGRYEVDLDLRFTVVDLGEPLPIRLAAYQPGTKGYEGEVPASPAHSMNVEVPEVREVRFYGRYETDAQGRLLLIRSANHVLEDSGRLRLQLALSDS